jgi:hypothetical protein
VVTETPFSSASVNYIHGNWGRQDLRTKSFKSCPGSRRDLYFSTPMGQRGSSRQAGGTSRVDADDPRGVRLVRGRRECLSAHTWRAKSLSNTAQISGIYTVATSQTMCKSTLA